MLPLQRRTTCVVGILVSPNLALDRNGFIEFEHCADSLASAFNDADERTRSRVGRLRRRTSRNRPEGYVANGCYSCDALQGNYHLQEELGEYLADGGEFEDLVIAEVKLPLSAIPTWGE